MDHTKSFYGVLVNTLIANVTTSFLWFALTFWMYLETRSVLATALLGGSYMLMVAVVGVPFGTWVDRWRKKAVMVVVTVVTAVAYMAVLQMGAVAMPLKSIAVSGMTEFRRMGAALCATSVLLLVALEELSYAEVADALGIPIGTVMSRLARGRERLRLLMEERPHGANLRIVR